MEAGNNMRKEIMKRDIRSSIIMDMHPAVFQRCHSIMPFEHILEIGLTGEAQIAADFSQGFICIPKQESGFPELAFCDVCPDGESQFLLEFLEQIGPAFSRKSNHIGGSDRFVDVGGNVLHTGMDFP